MAYINLDHLPIILNDLFEEVDDLESLKAWSTTEHFKTAVEEVYLANDFALNVEEEEQNKVEMLNDVMRILADYEKEFVEYQQARFANLETTRKVAALLAKVTGMIDGGSNVDTLKSYAPVYKTCKLDSCGATFLADPPTKEYCCASHRETAKKKRQRANV